MAHRQMSNTVRIGFDAKRIYNNFTGLGNYGRTVVENLRKCYPDIEIHLYTPKITEHPRTEIFLTGDYITHEGGGAAWRTWTIYRDINAHNIDVFHGLSHEIPFSSKRTEAKMVVTMHDLIFKTRSSDYAAVDRLIYERKCRYACAHADLIIAISENTKKDVMKYYKVPADRIRVIYQSCAPQFSAPVTEEAMACARNECNLPEAYFLYVGSIIRRKNLGLIVDAMHQLDEDDRLPLVVLGSGKSYLNKVHKKIEEYELTDMIHFFEDAPFELFPAIYKQSKALIYPSLYEGFGIPVIEALSTGTPVITSKKSSLPEAGGEAAIYINPKSVDELKKAMIAVREDSFDKEGRATEGKKHVAKFDADLLTRQLMEAYRAL